MNRGYVDFTRLYGLHEAGAFFVTRAKSDLNAHRVYSAATDRATGVIADQTIALDGHYTRREYPAHLRRVRFRGPKKRENPRVPDQFDGAARFDDLRPVQKLLAGQPFLRVDQTVPQYQGILRNLGKRHEDTNLDRRVGLRAGRHHPEAVESGRRPLHIVTGIFNDSI